MKDKAEYLRIGLIQTSLDQDLAWDSTPTAPVTMSLLEELRIWNEIKKGFSYLKSESENNRPHIIILPELTIPLSREIELQKIASKMGAVIIAGLDFQEHNGHVENKAVVIIPKSWPKIPSYGGVNKLYFGKTFFAYDEKKYFRDKNKIGKPWPVMHILDAGSFGRIGVAICSDFFDIERFLIYRGNIHHMIVIAYNKDVKSYYFLAEAISRLVYCNVVICNTGFYGGSIVFSLYKEEYKRYIYKHEGGKLFTSQILNLPVRQLDEAQTSTSDEDQVFKAKPPGYKNRILNRTNSTNVLE
jgi:predicted amidohydrolase